MTAAGQHVNVSNHSTNTVSWYLQSQRNHSFVCGTIISGQDIQSAPGAQKSCTLCVLYMYYCRSNTHHLDRAPSTVQEEGEGAIAQSMLKVETVYPIQKPTIHVDPESPHGFGESPTWV